MENSLTLECHADNSDEIVFEHTDDTGEIIIGTEETEFVIKLEGIKKLRDWINAVYDEAVQ